MKKHFFGKKFHLILIALIVICTPILAQNGTIVGTVLDETDSPMPFAAAVIQGTTIGSSTDINGKFTITGVPAGKHEVRFTFIGYQTTLVPVTVERGKTVELNAKLEPVSVEGKEVVVLGQARGQSQAINQQLNAPGIVNVVSLEKMKELPDANAADAVGRLPGIMVQRSGGEGEKVIIRGLDPKYSTVAVNGVVAPASSSTDRSTNMNLISPDIISGIEVSKANTADQDADGMGGTVNMLVKEADANRRLNAIVQTGYSGQIQQISNYKASAFFSDRFFEKKLGLMLSGNVESYDRSSDRLTVDYTINGFNPPQIGQESLRATSERRDRYNASAILDFRFNPKHVVKMVNMYSQTDRDVNQRRSTFLLLTASNENEMRFEQISSNPTANMVSSAFDGKHILGNTELIWAVSMSQTKSRTPNEHSLQFRKSDAFLDHNETSYLDPLEATNPLLTKEDIRLYYLRQGILIDSRNSEKEWSAKFDYKIPYSFLDKQVSGNIKFGGKWRAKDRNRETDRWSAAVYSPTGAGSNSILPVKDRGMYEPDAANGVIGIMSFLDPNFRDNGFLNGMSPYLNINYALDRDKVWQFFRNNNPYPFVTPDLHGTLTSGNLYKYAPNAKVKDEYSGFEDMYAAYLMSEMNIGRMITFIPGVRFDYQKIRYSAWKGEGIPDNIDADMDLSSLEKQTDNNSQLFILPQIHLKVKPLPWFDIRMAYTQTISRPDYDYLAPRMQINSDARQINFTTTKLNSSKSENMDVILSFFNSKYGLLTVGAFRKNISNFIYQRTASIIEGTPTDASKFGLENTYNGFNITYPLNNPGKSTINGLEIEGQTNFRWLPSNLNALRGIVLSGNVSFMESRSEYQATRIIFTQAGRENIDTVFVDRLLKQPSLLANVSVGYDIKGFSARLSYSFQDDILITPQQRMDGFDKVSTLAFSRWDLQLRQKLGKMVSLYFNMTNIFNNADRSIVNYTGYYTGVEYYGMGLNLGVKIDILK